ncbi:MAG: methyltransferase domain-containing protein [Ignavibacteriales bacterium]|nr:methyltransferase domain-containing protein [Ignavibacteriales bacterium]
MRTIEEAIKETVKKFPFDGYMLSSDGEPKVIYGSIIETVTRHLEPGSSILDFGCGPLDKTAILQLLGYHCAAFDDLADNWHKEGDNRNKILDFAEETGVTLHTDPKALGELEENFYDMAMILDVLEHLHESPKGIMTRLIELIKPGGLILISVPNAVNIRKRIDVLFGKTNLPPFEYYYNYSGVWRGHIREYTRGDLEKLADYLNLETLELRGADHMLERIPRRVRAPYQLITNLFKGWKDSWLFVGRKRSDEPRCETPTSG